GSRDACAAAKSRSREMTTARSLNPANFDHSARMGRGAVRTLALLDAGESTVWFTASGESELVEKIEFHVLRLAKAYRPRKDGEPWPVPGQDWTYLELGALTLPFEYSESADVPFGGGALSGTIRLNIATTARPYQGTMFESMSEISRIAPTGGTSFLRHGRRAVAGLDFEELWTRSSEKQELGFAIDYSGEANSGERPWIHLTLDGPAKHKAGLVGVWEAMLPTLIRAGQ
ncbi:MAG: T6SS immunity protein Tli4 family protein, partial [Anaeromyxobacteraceae bacterium]